MSGHSKWANIKHKKDAADRKKGKIFSRFTKEIFNAVKKGGPDPDSNPALRNVLSAARAVNMPNANIERAIKKATGEDGANAYEEIVYEGYAPGGVAVLVECLTDNKNRTAGEIRMLFDRGNGNLAGAGTVTWMFKRKSHFTVTGEHANEEKLIELLLDAGVDNVEVEDGVAHIYGAPEAFDALSAELQKAKIPVEEAGIIQVPDNYVEVKDPGIAKQVLSLIEKLDDHDDVKAVYSNLDIPAEIANSLS